MYLSIFIALIDSVYRKDKGNYSQMFLQECKYVVKGKNLSKFITDDIEMSSDDYDRESYDEENCNEEN